MTNKQLHGFWKTSEMYQQVQGLPVIRSLRALTGSLLSELAEEKGRLSIFSIGIGDGAVYKDFFREDIGNSVIDLVGVDISQDMLNKCALNLGVEKKVRKEFSGNAGSSFPLLLNMDLMQLIHNDAFNEWAKYRFDAIEAGLVLHHLPYKSDLILLFQKIFDWLSPKGIFVLADIDVSIAAYVEAKENMLRQAYSSVVRDSGNALFICRDGQEDGVSIPIIDENYLPDNAIVKRMDEKTCMPLRKEASQTNNPQVVEFVEQNITSAHIGLELHRSVDEWVSLLNEGAGQFIGEINIISSETIKAKFSDVIDNPFVIYARRFN